MDSSHFFIFKHLLFLWLLCFVIDNADSADHQKRDTHHMIVLRDNSRRRGKNHHDYRSRRHKRGKKQRSHYHHRPHEDESEELDEEREERDRDRSYERDNSFEDFLKKHSKRHRPKPYHYVRESTRDYKPVASPLYIIHPEDESDDYDPYIDESQYETKWTPITAHAIEKKPKKRERSKSKKPKRKRNHKSKSKHEKFYSEVTTESPKINPPQMFYENTNYPPLSSSFAHFDLSKAVDDAHRAAPLIGTIEQHKKTAYSVEQDPVRTDDFFISTDFKNKPDAEKSPVNDQSFSESKLLSGEVILKKEENKDIRGYGSKRGRKKHVF